MTVTPTRRGLLLGACSAAAHPLLSSVTLASAPGDARLVVIVLRGGMDGLDVVRPVGDPLYAAYRPGLIGPEPGLDADGYFALHPALAPLWPMWQRGELGFAHAVSTPYRNKRSHIDGQDLLEAGTGMGVAARDGWLNRLVGWLPGARVETSFGVGSDPLALLDGPQPVSRWSPDVDVDLTAQTEDLFRHIYAADPLFGPAADKALELAALIDTETLPPLPDGSKRHRVAAFAAERLLQETRIAAFSLNGWDTHQRQDRGLASGLRRLSQALLTLEEGLGQVWDQTLVLAMTEFGRTVAQNGSLGTDHGTGGAMVLAGGAARGGRVMGRWPGLDEAALFDRRDLMPTDDVRRYAALAIRQLYGVERAALEEDVFPGLDLGTDLRITL